MSNKLEYLDKNGLKKVLGLVKNNASAVWKGTKAGWDVLPAAEKQTYDLAVLLDETLVKAVDREDGTETDVANLNKIIHLTKAEYDAMPSHDPDTYYMITDDTTVVSPGYGYPRPDWANAVTITAAQLYAGYTAPADGMFVCAGVMPPANSGDTRAITINNVLIVEGWYSSDATYSSGDTSCPVSKGDLIKASISDAWASEKRYFVPWK